MAVAKDTIEAPVPPPIHAVVDRRGTCRLCFDDGGDLIAPCRCAGGSKWIHRQCLDQWRAMGANSRAMTNCPTCGFQYQLLLLRIMSTDADVRARRFMRRLAAHGIGCLVGTQIVIIVLGMMVRLIDTHERLVAFFGFPQDPGQKGHPSDFWNALQHHKITYYVCGVIALLTLLGLGTTFACCMQVCGRRGGGLQAAAPVMRGLGPAGRPMRAEPDWMFCCCECCRACFTPRWAPRYGWHTPCDPACCVDCARVCTDCKCDCKCPNVKDCCPGTSNNAPAHVLLILLLIIVVVLVLVGLLAAIMATVSCIQKAIQKYAQIQQMRVLAQEYSVQDLADPDDLGESKPTPIQQEMPEADAEQALRPIDSLKHVKNAAEQADVQAQMAKDLGEIFGNVHPGSDRADTVPAYGSTEYGD